MTILLSFSFLVMLSWPLYAQQQAGPKARTKPSEQNESTPLDNTAQMADIQDIKRIEKIGFNPALLGYAAMGAVTLALLTAVFLLWKKQQKKKIPEVVASISPEEAAVNSLAEFQDLMHSNGKQFYFRLSMVLREYIRQRYGMDAPEMTTEELLPRIAEIKLERDLDRGVRDFVHASDPVKFAGRPPEIETMQLHFEFVRDFVKKTTPLLTGNTTELNSKPVNLELSKISG